MITAKATSSSFTYLQTGEKITSTASATASANTPQKAMDLAQNNADQIAESVAENNAKIIQQFLDIASSTAPESNTTYFDTIDELASFQLPPATDGQFYNVITNFKNYKKINPQSTQTTCSTMCFDSTQRYIFTGSNSTGQIQGINYYSITCFDTEKSVYIQLPIKKGVSYYPDNIVNAIVMNKNILFIGLGKSSVSTFASLDCSFLYDSTKTAQTGWEIANYTNPVYSLSINTINGYTILYVGGSDDIENPFVGSVDISQITFNLLPPLSINVPYDNSGVITSLYFTSTDLLYASGNSLYIYNRRNNNPWTTIPFPNYYSNHIVTSTYNIDDDVLYFADGKNNLFSYTPSNNTPLFQHIATKASAPIYTNHVLTFCYNAVYPLLCHYYPKNGNFRTFAQNPNSDLSNSDFVRTILRKNNTLFSLFPTIFIYETTLPEMINSDFSTLLLENTNIYTMPNAVSTLLQYQNDKWVPIN